MNKILYILFFLLLSGLNVYAQNKPVESARVAYISQKVSLSPSQAEKFWPVYNELNNQKNDIRKTIRQQYEALSTEQSPDKIKLLIDQISILKQKEINLDKEYQNRILLILSARQLADLLIAEREFQKILLKKVVEE